MIQIETTENIIKFTSEHYPQIVNSAKSKCFITVLNLYKNIPSDKQFENERNYAKSVIKKYRKEVLLDAKNKILTRMIAMASFISIDVLRQVGFIYQWFVQNEIVRLKKPI